MRSTAGLLLALILLLSLSAQGHGRHTGTESHSRQHATSTTAKAAQCFVAKNGARQRPSSPGAEQKAKASTRVAESGAALHEFIYALHHSPLSFSLLCSYSPPQPPPDSPLNVALLCLPCLLLSSSRFPCKQTNNKKSPAFKSARSFSLYCSYSIN